MTKRLLEEYCEAEFENIEAVVEQLRAIIDQSRKAYSIPELAAIATFMHNFYNGIENILKRILNHQRAKVNRAATWHKDLLKAARDNGLVGKELYESLHEYLSFTRNFRVRPLLLTEG